MDAAEPRLDLDTSLDLREALGILSRFTLLGPDETNWTTAVIG